LNIAILAANERIDTRNFRSGVAMTKPFKAGNTGELADGEMEEVILNGLELMLARAGDNYYITDNRCTHLGGKLSQGTLKGNVVTCPLHGSQFDIRDGSVVRWIHEPPGTPSFTGKLRGSPRAITTYRVAVKDGQITVYL